MSLSFLKFASWPMGSLALSSILIGAGNVQAAASSRATCVEAALVRLIETPSDLQNLLKRHLKKIPERPDQVLSLSELPEDLSGLVKSEGGTLSFVGKGSNAHVYRWRRDGHEPIIVKRYDSGFMAAADDALLDYLRQAAPSEGPFHVVHSVRKPVGNLRFYDSVQGHSLYDLIKGRQLPADVEIALQRQYHRFLSDLQSKLEDQHGPGDPRLRRKEFPADCAAGTDCIDANITVAIDRNRWAYLRPFSDNAIVDSRTGEVWIVDAH